MFAAPTTSSAPPQSKPPVAAQTMVFGAASPVPPAPAPSALSSAGKTMVFGGPPIDPVPPAAPPARRPSQPLTFGTPAANQSKNTPPLSGSPGRQAVAYGANTPPSSSLRTETVLFGTPGGVEAATPEESPKSPGQSNQTVLFGLGPVDESAAAAKSQTMMFGRASGKATPKVTAAESSSPPHSRVPSESTVRVDLESVGPAEAARQSRPQRSEGEAVTPTEIPAAPERHNRTVLFAMNPSEEAAPSEPAPLLDAELSAPPGNQTLLFAGVGEAEPRPFEREDGASPDEAVQAPLSNEGSSEQPQYSATGEQPRLYASGEHQQLDLPPDVAPGDEQPGFEAAEADDEAAVASMRASANRRTTIAVIIFLVIALLIGLALAWYLFGRALVKGDAPRIEQESRAALATLRKDDEASQQAAANQTRALVMAHPDSVVARSALVMALSFLADDSNAEARRTQTRSAELKTRLESLDADSPLRATLESQLEQTHGQVRVATAQSIERENALRAEVAQLDASIKAKGPVGTDRLAALRARAVAAGVLGEVSALTLAEEFRQNASGPDNWADLALPEYVCNGGSSFEEALKQLEAVESRDDTFLRAYVLSARIHLIQHNPAGAESQLARVLAFHPGHDSAKRLQEWIVTHGRND